MQWLVFGLFWSGNEGLVYLINLVCSGVSWKELEGWIFSLLELCLLLCLGTIVNSLESHFGHDRAKNDSSFDFPLSKL